MHMPVPVGYDDQSMFKYVAVCWWTIMYPGLEPNANNCKGPLQCRHFTTPMYRDKASCCVTCSLAQHRLSTLEASLAVLSWSHPRRGWLTALLKKLAETTRKQRGHSRSTGCCTGLGLSTAPQTHHLKEWYHPSSMASAATCISWPEHYPGVSCRTPATQMSDPLRHACAKLQCKTAQVHTVHAICCTMCA